MAAQELSPATQEYLEKHKISRLMQHLYHDMLLALPADPLQHLLTQLQTTARPKIIISGPPAGGKGTQCALMASKYGVVHISTGDLLRDETRRNTPLGQQAQQFMSKGALVPDTLITQLVKERLATKEVKERGWLLDGFPRTKSQALSLQLAGILPTHLIVLSVPDDVVASRISGRRTDPVTGTVYHTEFNPPPEGVQVVQRADDTEDAIRVRLRLYHRNLDDVTTAYRSVVHVVDGNREKEAVFADIATVIDEARVD